MPSLPDAPRPDAPPLRPPRRERAATWLAERLLPAGLAILFSGMFWAGDRDLYLRLFYLLLALPAFVLLLLRPQLLAALAASPIFRAAAAFIVLLSLSIAWTSADDGASSLLRRPLYVLLLFAASFGVACARRERLLQALRLAAVIAIVAAAVTVGDFLLRGGSDRLNGLGALYNPLLTSHVYGFFLAVWIASWMSARRLFAALPMVAVLALGALLLATGSRTPLVALVATVLWLAALGGGRKGLVACAALAAAGVVLVALLPEALLSRGLSYRPEIWARTLELIRTAPLFGHGYDAPLVLEIPGLDFLIRDPHNLLLAVLYQTGAAGLALWALLYGTALLSCWRHRRDPLVFVCAAPLMYGLMAGMTEGGSFLSRPKEHWFLVWIPLTLLAAALATRTSDVQKPA